MVNTANTLSFQVGDAVYTADDHKVGTVKAFDANFVTVEHGLLLKSEYFIPVTAVNAQSNGSVYLTVTKSEIGQRGWDSPPLIETDAGNPPMPMS
ncbi:MAG: PRC-barrel domain-containing protein [Thermomicrobiales bacterium]